VSVFIVNHVDVRVLSELIIFMSKNEIELAVSSIYLVTVPNFFKFEEFLFLDNFEIFNVTSYSA